MKVALTPDLEQQVAARIESGAYGSASELVQEALIRLFEAEKRPGDELARLNRDIQAGIDQADRGDVVSGADSRQRLLNKFRASAR